MWWRSQLRRRRLRGLNMAAKLLLLIIAFPLLEVLILIKLGETIGFWPTVLGVIGSGFAGALLARIEGVRTWVAIQQELREGRMPAEKLIDALLVSVAGVFLFLPGLLSDIVGILLLIPGTRFIFKRWLRKKFDKSLQSGGSGDVQFFIR